jgi:DNA polymerase-3 subunit alpha
MSEFEQAKQHTPMAHLHVHTEYSLSDGATRIGALIKKVKAMGHTAVAITDHGNMHGAIDFYNEAKGAGIKAILGAEIYHEGCEVSRQILDEMTPRPEGSHHAFHLVLLAKTNQGYKSLMKIVSYGYYHGIKAVPVVMEDDLTHHAEDLIALSGCLKGEFARLVALLASSSLTPLAELSSPSEASLPIVEALRHHVQRMKETFGEGNYYIELIDNNLPDQKKLLALLVKVADYFGLPIVATCDAHYLNREDEKAHAVLTAIKNDLTMSKLRNKRRDARFHLLTNEEMQEVYGAWPEALENSAKIAEQCNVKLEFGKFFLPEYKLDHCDSIDEELRRLAGQGLEERLKSLRVLYGSKLTEEMEKKYWERLNYELGVIISMGFPGYFLIVQDFINWAKDHDIPVGPGRGSGAGSLVAYALRITDLDPFPLNLIFERFLNPERISMPDFDVDFCQSRRDEVITYVTQKYGQQNVGQITTFGKMKAKAAVRDVGRVLEIGYSKVDRIAKLIPNQPLDLKLKDALEQEPRLREEIQKDELIDEMINLALQIEGLNRHTSVHAAGVVISNGGMENYVPVYKVEENNLITQYEMKNAEKVGLVKFDFLGLKTLTVVKKAVDFVRKNRDKDFCIEKIDINDRKVYQEISTGCTCGIFQLESSGMQNLVMKLKPSCFEDIIAVVALFRPGPLGSGMVDDFIDRKHGRQEITYQVPELESILKETYGIILYQEQVQKIAATLASYSLGEADLLRRAMGKKKPEEMAKQKARFVDGATANKIDGAIAEELFDLMAKFAEYGFNKSHSAAYGLVSYQTAFLKTHYPEYFMAAIMTCDLDNTDKIVRYIEECRRLKFAVLSPDINSSELEFDVPRKCHIAFGLTAIKGIGASSLEPLIQERQRGGPFKDIHDLARRVNLHKVGKKTLELLTEAGALDGLKRPRSVLLAAMGEIVKYSESHHSAELAGQRFLFDTNDSTTEVDLRPFYRPDKNKFLSISPVEWLLKEKKHLGAFLSGHPLDFYQEDCAKFGGIMLSQVGAHIGTKKNLVVFLNDFYEKTTKTGRKFFILKLEDRSGSHEAAMYPNEKLAALPEPGTIVHVLTNISKSFDGSSISLKIDDIAGIEEIRKAQVRKVHVNVAVADINDPQGKAGAALTQLHRCMSQHPGATQVQIHLKYAKATVHLKPCATGIDLNDACFQNMKSLRSMGIELSY